MVNNAPMGEDLVVVDVGVHVENEVDERVEGGGHFFIPISALSAM